MLDTSPDRVRTDYFLLHLVEIATGLYILLLCQMTLVPFDFTMGGELTLVPSTFLAESYNDATTPNVVSNLAMFFPFGLLIYLSLARHRLRPIVVLPIAVLSAAAFSLTLEWAQAFSESRVSSAIDVLCNILGAFAGATAGLLCGRAIPRLLGTMLRTLHEKPRLAIVQSYVILLAVFAAMPFTYSVDGTWLKRATERATFVPFAEDAVLAEKESDAVERGSFNEFAMSSYSRQRLWANWIAELVSFALLAWLLHQMLREDYHFGPVRAVALVFWIAVPLAVVLSVLQWPNVLRGFHVTSIIVRVLGVCGGLIVRCLSTRGGGAETIDSSDRKRRWCATAACLGVAGYIVFTGLIPWMTGRARTAASWQQPIVELMPFHGYFTSKFHLMMQDFIGKLAAYMLLGILVTSAWDRLRDKSLGRRMLLASLVGLFISVPIEMVQIILPIRVTSLTDIIVASASCGLGVLVHEKVLAICSFASTLAGLPRTPQEARMPLNPTDELIATLAKPHDDAPREPAGQPHSYVGKVHSRKRRRGGSGRSL